MISGFSALFMNIIKPLTIKNSCLYCDKARIPLCNSTYLWTATDTGISDCFFYIIKCCLLLHERLPLGYSDISCHNYGPFQNTNFLFCCSVYVKEIWLKETPINSIKEKSGRVVPTGWFQPHWYVSSSAEFQSSVWTAHMITLCLPAPTASTVSSLPRKSLSHSNVGPTKSVNPWEARPYYIPVFYNPEDH